MRHVSVNVGRELRGVVDGFEVGSRGAGASLEVEHHGGGGNEDAVATGAVGLLSGVR